MDHFLGQAEGVTHKTQLVHFDMEGVLLTSGPGDA